MEHRNKYKYSSFLQNTGKYLPNYTASYPQNTVKFTISRVRASKLIFLAYFTSSLRKECRLIRSSQCSLFHEILYCCNAIAGHPKSCTIIYIA
jgi:hypothetical protein